MIRCTKLQTLVERLARGCRARASRPSESNLSHIITRKVIDDHRVSSSPVPLTIADHKLSLNKADTLNTYHIFVLEIYTHIHTFNLHVCLRWLETMFTFSTSLMSSRSLSLKCVISCSHILLVISLSSLCLFYVCNILLALCLIIFYDFIILLWYSFN